MKLWRQLDTEREREAGHGAVGLSGLLGKCWQYRRFSVQGPGTRTSTTSNSLSVTWRSIDNKHQS